MTKLIVNAVLFQIVWIVCVVLQMPLAAAATLALLVVHFGWIRPGRSEALCVVVIALAGIVADSVLTFASVFVFDDQSLRIPLVPVWLGCLWIGFATTVGVSLRPLTRYPLVCALVGAIAGPVAYSVGASLGAVSFGLDRSISLAAIALFWAIFLPLAGRFSLRMSPDLSRTGAATH